MSSQGGYAVEGSKLLDLPNVHDPNLSIQQVRGMRLLGPVTAGFAALEAVAAHLHVHTCLNGIDREAAAAVA